MSFFQAIYPQYALASALFLAVICMFFPRLAGREPSRALRVLVALNLLRFAGVAGALAALGGSREPAFLIQVALGDGITALLAVVAFASLWRRSKRPLLAVLSMNVAGLVGILTSEVWMGYLEHTGRVQRSAFIHGPTLGAALFTALHVLIFYFCALARRSPLLQGIDRCLAPDIDCV
jgi:hypothetical protein